MEKKWHKGKETENKRGRQEWRERKTRRKRRMKQRQKGRKQDAVVSATASSERQRRKEKIYPSECGLPKTSKERYKTFLGDHCKEMEQNNRMGKTRDLFKKIRDNKEKLYCAKMVTIKGQKLYGPNRSRR